MNKFRLNILSLTCFISFLVFWITFVITAVYAHCWTFEQFWFETYLSVTPYSWFLFLFILIALWWMSELVIFLLRKNFNLLSIAQLAMIFIFTLAMSAVFYNFEVYYQWTKKSAQVEELLFYKPYYIAPKVEPTVILINDRGIEIEVPRFGYEHWIKFRNQQTCDKGVDFTAMSNEQWNELYEKYEQLKRDTYEEAGLDYDNPMKYNSRHQESQRK